MSVYAHSLPGKPLEAWEPLPTHLQGVGRHAARLAGAFGWAEAGRVMGLLHDIGKTSAEFQAYLQASISAAAAPLRGGDHSTAGARVAVEAYGERFGTILAYGIAGHHAGLPDWRDGLQRRLQAAHVIPAVLDWAAQTGVLPPPASLRSPSWRPGDRPGFALAFLARMLFSCLVDADTVETRRFYDDAGGEPQDPPFTALPLLLSRLAAGQEARRPPATPIDVLRAEVLRHAVTRAALPPGLFTLTVPTGGGKTLTSLRFALEHACAHDLRRVVYVIPYTSIIEQTAAVFREALGGADVLEHHASFDWEAAGRVSDDAADADTPLARLRRAAENWSAPIVVTTAVQFFESLFAARRSRCRKLHNLALSVVILDEAQTLPLPLLQPCLAALEELAANYSASVVLCTATQPAIRTQDGFVGGLDIPAARELAPDPPGLHARLRRVEVEHRRGETDDATIAARFAERPQMLCIVNRRPHAASLFERLRGMEGAAHLTTLMCPAHRRAVLAGLRARLNAGEPVRLVATSLIEAGVDISFPEVWRELAGMDQITQAAGRCNREGEAVSGQVVVFTAAGSKPPVYVAQQASLAGPMLDRHAADPLSPEAVGGYFRQLYWNKGTQAFDTAKLADGRHGILPAIAEGGADGHFPFAQIADAFRMIDETMDAVIVPWAGLDGADGVARTVLARVAAMDKPLRADLRQLEQYTVAVPLPQRARWLAEGTIRPVNRRLGDTLLALPAEMMAALYDQSIGLRIDATLAQSIF